MKYFSYVFHDMKKNKKKNKIKLLNKYKNCMIYNRNIYISIIILFMQFLYNAQKRTTKKKLIKISLFANIDKICPRIYRSYLLYFQIYKRKAAILYV